MIDIIKIIENTSYHNKKWKKLQTSRNAEEQFLAMLAPILQVTQQSLREQIALIPQDITLFHRTLMENIRFGNIKATDEEIIVVAKKVHCHEFI